MELVTRRWGVAPLGVEGGGERREKGGAGIGSGKAGDGIGDGKGIGKREEEKASEEVGRKGKRGGQIKYR